MRGEHNELKVGITVTIALALFVIVLIFIGQWSNIFAKTKRLHIRFDHRYGVQGLRVKDPVRVGGLNVGRVKKIWLEWDTIKGNANPQKRLFVHVLAEIPAGIILYKDCKVSIGTKFVGEGGTLDIIDTGSKGKPISQDYVIDGQPPASFAQLTQVLSAQLDENNPSSLISQIKSQLNPENANSLVAKIHQILDNLSVVSIRIKTQLDEKQKASLMAKIHQAIDKVDATTAAIRKEMDAGITDSTLARIHLALDNLNASLSSARKMIEQTQPKVVSTVTHIENTSKRIDKDISMRLANEMDKNNKDSLMAKLHQALDNANASMTNLKTMTQTGKELLVINKDNLQAMIDNLAETASHLKATAKELRRHPWRLLYKPDQPEREYANLMESARAFSDAAATLKQANTKLVQLAKLHPKGIDPNDPELQKIREQIKKTFCNFEQAQKKLWNLLKMKS